MKILLEQMRVIRGDRSHLGSWKKADRCGFPEAIDGELPFAVAEKSHLKQRYGGLSRGTAYGG